MKAKMEIVLSRKGLFCIEDNLLCLTMFSIMDLCALGFLKIFCVNYFFKQIVKKKTFDVEPYIK